jgi:hypothetical protein
MQIGVLSSGRRYVLPDLTGDSRIWNFTIGPADASPLTLLHSAAATPGRYIAEMARRAAGGGAVTIVNPLLEAAPAEMRLVVSAAVHESPRATTLVIEDSAGRPLAYRLPADAARQRPVALLSGVDADADAALLGALTRTAVPTARLPLAFAFPASPEGFTLAAADADIYRWVARRATTELAAARDRDAVPYAVIMPFHAGDILFLLLALRRTELPVAALVVDRRYRDIVAAVAPHLACIEVDLAAGKSQAIDWDPALRQWVMQDRLPRGYLYAYCRPSRRYDNFPIHLIDQYAFACGAPALAPLPPSTAATVQKKPNRRVLVHVDGGWPMKIYPDAQLAGLIAALGEAGFAVTVLSGRSEERIHGQPNVRLRNLEHLRELLAGHDLLIGMDSFPAHYAAHVAGVPTLCLFASTQPPNSDAPPSVRYRALEAGLDCRPCRAVSQCPRFGGDVCRNFAAPDVVTAAAVTMWSAVYGEAL